MAILDHTLPLQVKSPDMMGMLDQGSKLAQFYTQNKADGEISKLYKQTGGDLDKMLEIGKQSPMARFVLPQLQAQKQAQIDGMLNQQKSIAEIGKVNSESYKNNQQGSGYGLDNSEKQLNSAYQALTVAAKTGDPLAVKLALNNSLKAGTIDDSLYQQFNAQIEELGNNPENIKQYAQSLLFSRAKDPDKYMFTTADNVLDNETSVNNNIRDNQTSEDNNVRTTQASLYNTNKDYELGKQNLEFNQQKAYFEQNKPMDYQIGNDGYTYAIYANGEGIRVVGEDGQPIKSMPKGSQKMSATAEKELFETTDAISSAANGIKNLKDALKYSAKAYDGVGATQRAIAAGNVPFGTFVDKEAVTATTMLDNIVTGNALEMLKATFGGAPTEGERAILLQLQGSANLPRAQREAIYTRAIQIAESRMRSNQAKAENIRNGSFFQSQGDATGGSTLSYFK